MHAIAVRAKLFDIGARPIDCAGRIYANVMEGAFFRFFQLEELVEGSDSVGICGGNLQCFGKIV
jgi:hypothetical protein